MSEQQRTEQVEQNQVMTFGQGILQELIPISMERKDIADVSMFFSVILPFPVTVRKISENVFVSFSNILFPYFSCSAFANIPTSSVGSSLATYHVS